MKQTTLGKPITLVGQGLHTGTPSKIRLTPAPAGAGITVQRMVADLHEPERLTPLKVKNTSSAIHVEVDGRLVKSVEHVLAALYGMGVDNVNLQVWGEEIPAMDGSAWPFVKAMAKAKIVPLKTSVEPMRLTQTMGVELDHRYVMAFPARRLETCVVVDYEHPAIGRQLFHGNISPEVFAGQLAKAKTFGWASRIKEQRAQGLIKGGTASNALIFGEGGLENPRMRTYPDEPVRHKTLDLLAALALLGGRFMAHVVAIRPGHALDVMFVKKVYEMMQGGKA